MEAAGTTVGLEGPVEVLVLSRIHHSKLQGVTSIQTHLAETGFCLVVVEVDKGLDSPRTSVITEQTADAEEEGIS